MMKLFDLLFKRNIVAATVVSAIISTFAVIPQASVAAPPSLPEVVGGRTVSIVSTSAAAGSQVVVQIVMDSQGNEVAVSFTLSFDPLILSNPVASLGSDAPGGAAVSTNADMVSSGRLGVLVDSFLPFAQSPPNRQLVTVRFDVNPNAFLFPSTISFITSPTPFSVGTSGGALESASFQGGTVTVTSPTVSLVTIGGRVTTPSGQNLRNAVVSLIDSSGVRRLATTSPFGLYSFENVATGQTYTLSVGSKRYRFAPKVQPVTAAISNLDFVGLE